MKKIVICLLAMTIGITQINPVFAMEVDSSQTDISVETTGDNSYQQNNEGDIQTDQSVQIEDNLKESEDEVITQNNQTETDNLKQENTMGEQNQDDFVIENGVLVSYNGDDSEVIIPEGVTEIGDEVFLKNKVIKSVVFPNSLERIGDYAFKESGLRGDLALTKNIKKIDYGAFSYCNFDTVYIPVQNGSIISTVSAFSSSDIDKVVFEEGTTTVPNIFENANVREIQFPNSIIEIETSAFSGNEALTELVLPDGITTLGAWAFSSCSNLKKVTIPASLNEVAYTPVVNFAPFSNCMNLKEVVFKEGVETIPNILFSKTGIEVIQIPDSVTTIEKEAFSSCSLLKKIFIPKSVTTIEKNVFKNSTNVTIYCAEDSTAHKYALENNIPFILDDLEHEHEYGDWEIYTEATCIQDGLKRRICSCGVSQDESIQALGHDFSDKWFIDTEPTCLEDGWRSHHCTRCEETNDNEKIDKLGHSYGAWIVSEEATYFKEGKRYHECERCNNSEEEIIPILEPDFEANPDYSFAELQVVDAQSLQIIEGALIQISNNKETFKTTTNEDGKAKVFIPNGSYDVIVSKEGYMDRSFTYAFESGKITVPQIGISTGSVVTGELTVTEMTKDEILDAGIDISAPENQHVFKYEVTLKFTDGLEIYTIPSVTYKNNKGESIKSYFGDESNTGNEFVINASEKITITKVSEYLYIVVQGETKWLKEMFHVQLLVVNTSLTDDLVDCNATLNLPDGLSLAKLSTGSQSANQKIDKVALGESETLDWYIRGDKTGDYNISAALNGKFSSFNDPFEYTFKTQTPLHVYAGTDMHLTVHCSDAAYFDEPYTMIFELENVSDHTIYNVEHKINNVSQYQVKKYTWIEDGKIVDEEEVWNTLESHDFGKDGTVSKEEFKPGEKLAVLVKTDIMWESPLNRLKDRAEVVDALLKLGGISSAPLSVLSSAISFIDVRYYLTDILVSYADDNTTQIPISFDIEHHSGVNIYDKVFGEILEEMFDKVVEGAVHILSEGLMDENSYTLYKKLNERIEIKFKDSNTEAIVWVEDADGGSNVLSIHADGATTDENGRLILKKSSEISVDALNTGEAYLIIQDDKGNISKRHFTVYEMFPGQKEIASDIEDLMKFGFMITPFHQKVSEELITFYKELGFTLQYEGTPLKVGDLIPTGSVIVDKNSNEVLTTILPGDANSDAQINLFDGYSILGMANQEFLNETQKAASNFNGDTYADKKDTTYLFDFLTQPNISTYALPSVEKSTYHLNLQNILHDVENIRGIQLDISNISDYGIIDASVSNTIQADFNQSVYNKDENRIRSIIANYDSTLDISQGLMQLQFECSDKTIQIPAKFYIQTDSQEIIKEINLEFNKTSGGSEDNFQETVDQFEDTINDFENMLENLEGSDSIKSEFQQVIEEIKENLKHAQSIEDIHKLQEQLQNAYQKFQEDLKNEEQEEIKNPSHPSSDKENPKHENETTQTGVYRDNVFLFIMISLVSLILLILIRKKISENHE